MNCPSDLRPDLDLPVERPAADLAEEIPGVLPPRAMSYLLLVVAVSLGGLLLWAHLSVVDVVVTAPGVLVPLGEEIRFDAPMAGELRDLRVGEGDQVEPGQVLFTIDAGQSRQDLGALRAAQDAVARADEELRTAFPRRRERRELEIAQERDAAERLERLIEGKREALARRKDVLAGEREEGESAAEQARLAQRAKRIEAEVEARRLEQAVAVLERSERLHAGGALAYESLEAARLRRVEAEAAVRRAGEEIERDGERVAELEAGLRSSSERERLVEQEAENETRELESRLALGRGRIQALELEVERERDRLDLELREARSALESSRIARHPAEKDGVVEVRATRSGIVTRLAIKHAGKFVAPGEAVLAIAPSDAGLAARVLVANADIADVETGMEAQIQYAAYPYQWHGVQGGRVVRIAPDAVADPQRGRAYEVDLELDRTTIEVDGRSEPLRLGLQAEVHIVTGRKSLLESLLEPVLDLWHRSHSVRS